MHYTDVAGIRNHAQADAYLRSMTWPKCIVCNGSWTSGPDHDRVRRYQVCRACAQRAIEKGAVSQ
jgi:hypothetical protein